MEEGQTLKKLAGEGTQGDDRYHDSFYQDMTDYYAQHHIKHGSPTKRLVKQKDATVKIKQSNPDNKDKQLYLTDANLKTKKKKMTWKELEKPQVTGTNLQVRYEIDI